MTHSTPTRRHMFALAAAAAAAVPLAGIPTLAHAADSDRKPNKLLLRADFPGRRLDRNLWNPWVTDLPSKGIPWFYRPELGQPNSALGGPNTTIDEYDLASNIDICAGLMRLRLTPGSPIEGYSHTGAVVNTLPSTGDYGDGVTKTRGFTFVDARVDIVARMPRSDAGGWGSIWFMNADPAVKNPTTGLPANHEIDLVETGFDNGNGKVPGNGITSTFHSDEKDAKPVWADIDLQEPVERRFHTFTLEYKRGAYIRTFVDGRPVMETTANIPTCPYFLMISNQVASSLTDGWHTQKKPGEAMATDLQVRSVTARRI